MVRKAPYTVTEPMPRAPQIEKFPIVSAAEPTMFCSHFDNGVQCTTEITKKSKTKLCGPHRRMLNKKKKQETGVESGVNSPNPMTPLTPSSNTMSPVTPTPHPANYTPENLMHMIPSRSYRPPASPAIQRYPNHATMFPNQVQMAPHPGEKNKHLFKLPTNIASFENWGDVHSFISDQTTNDLLMILHYNIS